jgi:hypothetical protein
MRTADRVALGALIVLAFAGPGLVRWVLREVDPGAAVVAPRWTFLAIVVELALLWCLTRRKTTAHAHRPTATGNGTTTQGTRTPSASLPRAWSHAASPNGAVVSARRGRATAREPSPLLVGLRVRRCAR